MKKKGTKIAIAAIVAFWVCYIGAFAITCAIKKGFDIRYLISSETIGFFALLAGIALAVILFYFYSHYWLLNSKNIIKGKDGDLHLKANLEEARFQSEEEIAKNYKTLNFNELKNHEIVGTPIMEKESSGELKVTFAKPAHSLVIGTKRPLMFRLQSRLSVN